MKELIEIPKAKSAQFNITRSLGHGQEFKILWFFFGKDVSFSSFTDNVPQNIGISMSLTSLLAGLGQRQIYFSFRSILQ